MPGSREIIVSNHKAKEVKSKKSFFNLKSQRIYTIKNAFLLNSWVKEETMVKIRQAIMDH